MSIDYTLQTRDRPFKEHATLCSGLMAYWGFNGANESIGTTSAYYNWDSTGVYHLQCSAGAPLPKTNPPGVPNYNPQSPYYVNAKALQFQVSGQTGNKFDLTTNDFRFSGDFSVSFWGKKQPADEPTATVNIIRATAGATKDWEVYINNTNPFAVTARVWDSASGSASVGQDHNGTNDTHFVVVYDSATKIVTLYMNGSGSSSSALTNGLRQGSTTLEVYDTHGLRWQFDELAVYNRKLTSQEITDLRSPLLYSSPNPTGP
jgi:hypothetical protein